MVKIQKMNICPDYPLIYGKFFFESYIRLVVKLKVHNGGLVLKGLKYILESNFVYILII